MDDCDPALRGVSASTCGALLKIRNRLPIPRAYRTQLEPHFTGYSPPKRESCTPTESISTHQTLASSILEYSGLTKTHGRTLDLGGLGCCRRGTFYQISYPIIKLKITLCIEAAGGSLIGDPSNAELTDTVG